MAGFGQEKKDKSKHRKSNNISENYHYNSAIDYHRKGELGKAELCYRKALTTGQSYYAAHLNLGVICKNSGRFEEAASLYKKANKISPNRSDGYTNLGNLYRELGRFDEAVCFTLKSLELKPHDPDTHINLGDIYRELGKLDQALASTLKSLELKPNNPDAHLNLGGIYKDLGKLDQALTSTLKSIELKPDNPDALTNLGGILKELGKLDQALISTLKSIRLNPFNPTAHMNLGIIYEALNKPDHALQSYMQSAKLIAKQKDESCLTSLISASIILIQTNKIEHAKTALRKAIKIVENKDKLIKATSTKNQRNNGAYLTFLSKLINEVPALDSQAEARILHIGDSHCLSFTNQKVLIKSKQYTIQPSLIKGAKAYHLSEKARANRQRISFKNRLQGNIDNYAYIFLSFGEIDCREDEGILKYCEKTGKSIQKISEKTARLYFAWTKTALSRYKKKLIYFGTPAPFTIDLSHDNHSREKERRLLATRIFNMTLKEECHKSNIQFADVYKLTAGENGYNNNEWVIDSIHLKPKALNKLIASLQD